MSGPAALQNVTYWAEQDPHGRVFLWFQCSICGDSTQKLCGDPVGKMGYWASVYRGLHPYAPHAR
jgi:hypothetical protein